MSSKSSLLTEERAAVITYINQAQEKLNNTQVRKVVEDAQKDPGKVMCKWGPGRSRDIRRAARGPLCDDLNTAIC